MAPPRAPATTISAPEQHQLESSTTRARSFGGCSTCRSRHVKCDEGRPACVTCISSGINCGGYEKNIFFTSTTANHDAAGRFRRPLFTERERENMSKWLTASVSPGKASKILFQIDEECEGMPPFDEVSLVRGPFGAFRLASRQQVSTDDLPQHEIAEISTSTFDFESNDDYPNETHFPTSPWSQNVFESMLDQPEVMSLPFPLDFADVTVDLNRFHQILGVNTIVEGQSFLDTLLLPQSFAPSRPSTRPPSIRSPTPTISLLATPENQVPPNASVLLQHYATTIISALTPYRHSKTPWHVLFLPFVRQCFAILMLNDSLDNAGMCIFYGTLSLSAFSLEGSSQSSEWLKWAKTYRTQAQKHAGVMLKHAYDLPKKFKYKSVLMALLTLVYGCIFSDNRDQTEYYLLEAEKFIRLRGLSRKKSRKVRLLHHCYAFTRVFHESMSMFNMNTIQRNHVRNAVQASGLTVHGSDIPVFRINGWNDWHQEMMLMKSREEGENDLHLERPGQFPATLYPEIFGIPESWLLLLSQVIRLGNEKDSAEQSNTTHPLGLKDFTNRARAIEKAINQLDLTSQPITGMERPAATATVASDPQSQSTIDPDTQQNMLEAMKDALAIYFYRRIYDIDATILQPKVINIRDCLIRNQHADADIPYGSAEVLWPAFIAACEAEDPDVQSSFAQWFAHYSRRSGLRAFDSALELVERVWQEKRGASVDGDGIGVSWLELMRRDFMV